MVKNKLRRSSIPTQTLKRLLILAMGVFVLFSLLAFCILAVSVAFFALSVGTSYIGAVLSLDDHGWTVQSVDPNGLAIQTGIKVGDRPIEINGQTAQTFLPVCTASICKICILKTG